MEPLEDRQVLQWKKEPGLTLERTCVGDLQIEKWVSGGIYTFTFQLCRADWKVTLQSHFSSHKLSDLQLLCIAAKRLEPFIKSQLETVNKEKYSLQRSRIALMRIGQLVESISQSEVAI